MPRYAQIDENGYVVSDSHLSGMVGAENMIPLAPEFDLRNKRWNGTGWEEYEADSNVVLEPTQLDRIEQSINQSNTYLSKTYSEIENKIIDNYTMSLIENNII